MEDEPEDGEDRKREDEHNSPGNAGPGNSSANTSGNAMAAGQGTPLHILEINCINQLYCILIILSMLHLSYLILVW